MFLLRIKLKSKRLSNLPKYIITLQNYVNLNKCFIYYIVGVIIDMRYKFHDEKKGYIYLKAPDYLISKKTFVCLEKVNLIMKNINLDENYLTILTT